MFTDIRVAGTRGRLSGKKKSRQVRIAGEKRGNAGILPFDAQRNDRVIRVLIDMGVTPGLIRSDQYDRMGISAVVRKPLVETIRRIYRDMPGGRIKGDMPG